MAHPTVRSLAVGQAALVALVLFFSSVGAQEVLHPRFRVHPDGVLRDQDYFDAGSRRQTMDLLRIVEAYHLNKDFWDAYRAGRHERVTADLTYILDKFPNHPKALVLMGTVARITNKPSSAILYYTRALALYPQYALTHAQLGRYLVDVGGLDAGIARLEEAIKMDPNLPFAHAALAEAYQKSGATAQAREAAARARTLGYKGRLPQD